MFAAAAEMLANSSVPLVIVERDLPLGTWQDALAFLRQTEAQPLVIVVSRTADERFWAEVLNLGGHNVLATPFRPGEVEWVLETARLTLSQRSKTAGYVRQAAQPRKAAHRCFPQPTELIGRTCGHRRAFSVSEEE
jgi:DNA-binding response OmpR family regulator